MSYSLIPSADYKAMCDAIRAKTGKTDLIKSGDMAAEIENVPTGGGLDINGVVKEYQVNAGASVNAGDFVEFVTRWGNGEFNSGNANYISAVALSDSKVLVAYGDAGNSSYGTAVIFTINDTTVSMGDKCIFHDGAITHLSAVALSDSKVLVAYGTSVYCYVKLVTINGTTITTADDHLLLASYKCFSMRAVALSSTKVCVAYDYIKSNVYTAKIVVVTLDGDTLTKGTALDYGTADAASQCKFVSLVKLTSSKVLALYSENLNPNIAVVFTINNTTVKKGLDFVVDSETTFIDYRVDAAVLSDSKVLVAYGDNSVGKAVVLTISGTEIFVGEITTFREGGTSYVKATALSDSKVLVAYYGSAIVLTVEGTTISAGTPLVFNSTATGGTGGGYKDLVALSSNTVFVAFSYNAIGLYKCLKIEDTTVTVQDTEDNGTVVQPATSRLHNVGVAKTSGAEGETVEVYCVT